MTKYAFSLHTIMSPAAYDKGTKIQPNTVFKSTSEEFKRLEGMGAVREPTDEEKALADLKDEAPQPIVEPPVAAPEIPAGSQVAKAPDSGAEGDPNSKPKGATASTKKVDAKAGAEGEKSEAKTKDEDI